MADTYSASQWKDTRHIYLHISLTMSYERYTQDMLPKRHINDIASRDIALVNVKELARLLPTSFFLPCDNKAINSKAQIKQIKRY